jgi:opacity protein-like surface antigen
LTARICIVALVSAACSAGPRGSEPEHAFLSLEPEADSSYRTPTTPAPNKTTTAHSEPPQNSSLIDRWEYELVPYLWYIQLDGTQTLDGVNAPLDIEFGDGDFAYGLQFGAQKGRWGVLAEVLYLDATGTAPNAMGMATTSEVEQLLLEFDVAYQISRDVPIEILGGLRYNRFDNSLAVMGGPSATGRAGFFDPILGARIVADFADRWSFLGRLDFGGFRAGSEFSWNTQLGIRYRTSDLLSLDLAYRILDIDYESSDFAYDARTSGLVLGVGFHW